ncbi:MAG TPA: hypothetical protein PKI05_14285, partial [Thermogutta sp.]|nr:hypothetical protein [Thermogutta sp.]
GLLDLCVYGGGGFWRGLWYTVTTQVGIHERVCDFVRIWGTRFRVTSNEPVPYQIDGDPAGYLPLDIGLAPGRVRIVVPERTAEMLQKQRRQSEAVSRVKNGSLVCA